MTSDYRYFDETPVMCPGCGETDHDAQDGPSYLMITWMALASSYLCIDCRQKWATWESGRTTANRELTDNYEPPKVVQNLDRIAKGEDPLYVAKPRAVPQSPVAGGPAPVVA